MRESVVEKAVVQHAKKLGWLTIKMNGHGSNGKPDHMFLKKGFSVFVEFKRLGEKPRKLQELWAKKIEKAGGFHFIIDSIGLGKLIFSELTEEMNKHG